MKKDLKEKAIKIQGKDYVLVSDRIIYFNDTYLNSSISTELISESQSVMVVVKATILPDLNKPERKFTGHSQAKWGEGFINKTSALENAETSAVGRALAMMGIGVIDSIASVDEIKKTTHYQKKDQETEQKEKAQKWLNDMIMSGQIDKSHKKSTYKEIKELYKKFSNKE